MGEPQGLALRFAKGMEEGGFQLCVIFCVFQLCVIFPFRCVPVPLKNALKLKIWFLGWHYWWLLWVLWEKRPSEQFLGYWGPFSPLGGDLRSSVEAKLASIGSLSVPGSRRVTHFYRKPPPLPSTMCHDVIHSGGSGHR